MNLIKTFLDMQYQGGVLMWIIFATGIASTYIGFDKLLFLNSFSKYRKNFIKHFKEIMDGKSVNKTVGIQEYDTLLSQLKKCLENKCNGQKGYFREFLISTVPGLERHFSTMNALVSIAPLLGLLGTVMGMVQTFKVIMDFGVGNPALTAEGISVALLTTQAGLTVAFPVMLFHNHLINKKNSLLNNIIKDFEEITKKTSPIKIEG